MACFLKNAYLSLDSLIVAAGERERGAAGEEMEGGKREGCAKEEANSSPPSSASSEADRPRFCRSKRRASLALHACPTGVLSPTPFPSVRLPSEGRLVCAVLRCPWMPPMLRPNSAAESPTQRNLSEGEIDNEEQRGEKNTVHSLEIIP